MSWVEALAGLLVSHLAGDFLLQTNWQATHKFTGLGPDRAARRALFMHVGAYALAFVPALVWIGTTQDAATAMAVASMVVIPHLILDDGRLVLGYVRTVKRSDSAPGDFVFIAVDQSFHVLLLLVAALVAAA